MTTTTTTKPPPRKRLTVAKAARLIAAMEAIRECDDFPDELMRPFDDVREAISPYYDID